MENKKQIKITVLLEEGNHEISETFRDDVTIDYVMNVFIALIVRLGWDKRSVDQWILEYEDLLIIEKDKVKSENQDA